jgi:REP element-mobilizing transposase RayT
MARPIRVEFANAVYHVTARGNERKAIYRDAADRLRFLETVEEAVTRFAVVVHAYCLMSNHYHLLLQTPRANLSAAAGWLQTTYSVRFNRRHRRSGHLFQGRFKAHLVEEDAYAMELVKYIHLNPVRPRNKRKPIPAERKGELRRYRWSSHRAYAGLDRKHLPAWLCLEWLGHFGHTRRVARTAYGGQIDAMFGQVIRSPWEDLRHGLVLGGDALWKKVRGLVVKAKGDEEIRWRRRTDAEETSRLIQSLVAGEADRRVAIWLRVRLGGERMTTVAADYGYRDGSGIHRVVQRLDQRAQHDPALARRLKTLTQRVSSVKS